MKHLFILLIFLSTNSFSFAQEKDRNLIDEEHLPRPNPKSPEQIQKELDEDEALFKRAQEMFNPWYTGPLLTPSASMMPPGYGNIQPYLFVNDYYAAFDNHRKSQKLENKQINLNPSIGSQFGITKTMDIALTLQGNFNWQNGESGGGFGDMICTVGWPIVIQTLWIPQMKFTITQTFPSGRYQKLDSNRLNASGGGVWATQFGFAISKVMFWSTKHPFYGRLFIGYNIPVPSTMNGFNAYGGGYNAKAKVRPGNSLKVDLGMELSLTQRWVIANDIVYTAQNETTYSGNPGTTSTGAVSTIGGGFSDNLSLAPAIEYNFSPNLGLIGGAWFSVYGRNSTNFATAVLSIVWTFGPL